jgi:uncharacterized protein YcgI (DUF1989 family)
MSDRNEIIPPPYGPKSYNQLHLTEGERGFYRGLAEDSGRRRKVAELVVPARTGAAFSVLREQLVRIECHEDAQVADLNLFNRDNPKEHFSSTQTRAVHGSHLTAGAKGAGHRR